MTETPEVSVIVPVYNAATHLDRLFAALTRQTVPERRFEVIVVDDGSTDSTPDLVQACPFARLVAASQRSGSYAARNLGVAAARSNVLAFTDADCEPTPDWLERGLDGISAGDVDILAGRIDISLDKHPSVAALLDAARHLDQQAYAAHGFAATANMWTRRDVLDHVGTFDGTLRSSGDAEFGKRATAAGARLRYAHDVVVEHPPRVSLRELAKKQYRLGFGVGQRAASKKGPSPDPRIRLMPNRWIGGLERLRGRDLRFSRARLAQMLATQYVAIQLPMLAGVIAARVRGRRGPARAA